MPDSPELAERKHKLLWDKIIALEQRISALESMLPAQLDDDDAKQSPPDQSWRRSRDADL